MTNNFDKQYKAATKRTISEGTLTPTRTGVDAYQRFGQEFRVKPAERFPILTTKRVPFRVLVGELLWIWLDQSNDVNLLRGKYNVNVWNEWQLEDGSIGKAYGYQVKKLGLMDKLLDTLNNNPYDRGMVLSLWNEEDLPHMALRPCAFQTIWMVDGQQLNLHLVQRSGDAGLGIPFNIAQYAVLQAMVAQVSGLEVGELLHTITNYHVYENHRTPLLKQFKRKPVDCTPKLWLNPEITNFYDFTPDDIKILDYEPHGTVKMEVAV